MIPTPKRRRPGYVVQCQDGALGRTYHDDEKVQGKIKVYVFAAPDDTKKVVGDCVKNRLCDPDTLKVVGMTD